MRTNIPCQYQKTCVKSFRFDFDIELYWLRLNCVCFDILKLNECTQRNVLIEQKCPFCVNIELVGERNSKNHFLF